MPKITITVEESIPPKCTRVVTQTMQLDHVEMAILLPEHLKEQILAMTANVNERVRAELNAIHHAAKITAN